MIVRVLATYLVVALIGVCGPLWLGGDPALRGLWPPGALLLRGRDPGDQGVGTHIRRSVLETREETEKETDTAGRRVKQNEIK